VTAGEPGSSRALRRRADRCKRRGRVLAIGGAVLLVVAAAAGAGIVVLGGDEDGGGGGSSKTASKDEPATTTTAPATTTTAPPFVGFVDPATVGQPYGSTVPGVLTFRGNPTRTYYGQGPIPTAPRALWQYPGASMCSLSDDGEGVTNWCGTGWTGQPAVFERDGRTWVVFGAYDRAVHFVDAATGQDIIPPFPTGDIIKGSVTIDPDGFPIVYTGSRDGFFRAIAFDRPQPTELWKMQAEDVQPTMWNDDWDGSALVLDDFLFEGGENSQFHIVKLNRGTGPDGLVTVAPQLVFNAPGWDDELIAAVGDEVSIENSVAVIGDVVYFANSGGLVQGWDISGLRTGAAPPTRVFRFWVGEDVDASVVADAEGMLYVGSEWEKQRPRAAEVGQVLKLNPAAPNPVVWAIKDQGADTAGVWGTPGLYQDLVIVPTNGGRVLGIDRATGVVRWEKQLPGPVWQSPVIVDGVWIQGDCGGVLHAYDVRNTMIDPPELWSVTLGGCIESTPTVWKGRIYVGTRAGSFFAIGDA
jgi:outer membrane protein assembly factor BamB